MTLRDLERALDWCENHGMVAELAWGTGEIQEGERCLPENSIVVYHAQCDGSQQKLLDPQAH